MSKMSSNIRAFKDKFIWFGIMVIAGISLCAAGVLCSNDYVKGIGIGFAAVAVLKIVQYLFISRNDEKAKQYQVASGDDRLKGLAQKAGHLTLMITIIAGVLLVAGFGLAGMQTVSFVISMVVCAESLLYMAIYFIMQRKY
jgi:phosphatidylserine synthase